MEGGEAIGYGSHWKSFCSFESNRERWSNQFRKSFDKVEHCDIILIMKCSIN